MNIFLILLADGLFLSLGDFLLKKWVLSHQNFLYMIGAIFSYTTASLFMASAFKLKNMTSAVTICVAINIVAVSIFSYMYFKEPLSIKEIFGVLLGISSIILLCR